MLAAHAAIAIENARLYERSRELSVVEERNRVARELHDSVTQNLFGVVLAAEAAATLLDRDADAARVQLQRVQELARAGMEELRSLIFELRPAALADEGLAATLRKHLGILRRVHQQDISLKVAGDAAAPAARTTATSSASPRRPSTTRCATPTPTTSRVGLDGAQRPPRPDRRRRRRRLRPGRRALRARRLGLTSMEERAKALGGDADDRLAAGRGHAGAARGRRS